MNYIEALQALVDGKKIRHKSWDKGEYAYIRECLILTNVGTTRTFSTNCLPEITDDRWELYQTEEDKLIQAGKRWELYNACHSKSCGCCASENHNLFEKCMRIGASNLLNNIKVISDDEVDKLYKALKGEKD